MVMNVLALSDLTSAWLIHSLGPVHTFLLAPPCQGLCLSVALSQMACMYTCFKPDIKHQLLLEAPSSSL